MNKPTQPAQIAIQNGKLAIFGSPFGYLGEVIQDYTPFADESMAIAEARQKVSDLGRQCETEISRPRITKMTMTYGKK